MIDQTTTQQPGSGDAGTDGEDWNLRQRVADSVRRLMEVLVTSSPGKDQLEELATMVDEYTERFAVSRRAYGRDGFPGGLSGIGNIIHEFNALSGRGNPAAPPVDIVLEGNEAHGKVRMGWQYEGPPGCVHGGLVAALLDECLGIAQVPAGRPGMTGTLEVRYLSPTPVDAELDLRARVDRVEGRKTLVSGEIRAGETVTATCKGTFIQPRGYAGNE